MPNRILRDGIIESEQVNVLSPGAEILYRRLMSKVDDFGRFYGHPALILAACYPLQLNRVTCENVADWLAECEQQHCDRKLPLITTYEIEGKKYLEINNFGQRTRTESKFPPQSVRAMLTKGAQLASTPRLAHARSEASAESEAKTESEASAEAADARAPIPAIAPPVNGTGNHAVVVAIAGSEARIRVIADQCPDQQDYETGVKLAVKLVRESADPEAALREMELNIPRWFDAMKNGNARVKCLRFVLIDQDYRRKPREPGRARAPDKNQKRREEVRTIAQALRDK